LSSGPTFNLFKPAAGSSLNTTSLKSIRSYNNMKTHR